MQKFVRFFDPGKSYKAHREEYLREFDRVLSAGDLVLRGDLEQFEHNLATFTGRQYGVGLNSGTDALYLALKVVGVGPGDEVIVSAHTFVASIQVIVQLGATPVLVDLGQNWQDFISEKTKAVVPCHISGEVLDWQPVEGIPMIDDSCQALGAIGLKGDIQCWSFYPAKILGAFGDAGGITTDVKKYADDIKDLGNHWKSDYSKWGINSRLDNLQAAVLNIKLKYLRDAIARRQIIAWQYLKGLNNEVLGLPKDSVERVWQDFIILTTIPRERNALYLYLKEKGVETMKNEYPFPIIKPHKAADYEARSLRLPCNENLTDDEVKYVIEAVNSFYE